MHGHIGGIEAQRDVHGIVLLRNVYGSVYALASFASVSMHQHRSELPMCL